MSQTIFPPLSRRVSDLPKNQPATGKKENPLSYIAWKGYEKIAFRFLFIYFLLQALPLDRKFYRDVFSISWSQLYYGDIFQVAHYTPHIIPGGDSFFNWGIIAFVAVIGTITWSNIDHQKKEYNNAYYALRAILRYRLAIAVIAYGFIKFFPLQSPFPSISDLNTSYGDFTTWKVFSVSLGAAPLYEKFLGTVEILAGLLLLYRKTATIGAFIIVSFTGNIFLSNVAYEGGEYVYSLYLISIAVFLLAWDARRLYTLLALGKPTKPNRFKFSFKQAWQQKGAWALKSLLIFFFVLLYGFKTYQGYRNDQHHIPATKGLANASGYYNVREFRINNQVLPYSATDPVRWQNVVFEKWNTISIKSNRPIIADINTVEKVSRKEEDKTYEEEGTTGRHYYSYTVDPVQNILTLHNKNKNYPGETLVLHYSSIQGSPGFVLSGTNENKDPVFVVLDKIDKKYLLTEGRRKPQKL
jgi:hypothetical protein